MIQESCRKDEDGLARARPEPVRRDPEAEAETASGAGLSPFLPSVLHPSAASSKHPSYVDFPHSAPPWYLTGSYVYSVCLPQAAC